MITHGFCTSAKVELLNGEHNFTSDTFKVALYLDTADLGPNTTVYTTTGEVSVSGYTAGGATITVAAPASSGTTAYVDFTDVSWTAEITARGALIYNSSNGNKAFYVLDFGVDRAHRDGVFTITWPSPTSTSAIIRIP